MQTPGFLVKTPNCIHTYNLSFFQLWPVADVGRGRGMTGSITPPACSPLPSAPWQEGEGRGNAAGRRRGSSLTGLDQWWTSHAGFATERFLGFLEASLCWQSLTDLSFDVGASSAQSLASSHRPRISCGAFPSLNAPSSPNTAHLPFNHLVGILSDHRKKKARSGVSDSPTPRTGAHQAPPRMGFSRQEYWSGVPLPSPGDLPDSGIEPRSPTMRADALASEPPGNQPFLILILRKSKLGLGRMGDKPRRHSLAHHFGCSSRLLSESFGLHQAWDPSESPADRSTAGWRAVCVWG